jgi:phytanoyl-CoA hydroxylase
MAAIQHAPQPAPKQRTNYGSFIDTAIVSWLQPSPRNTPLSEMKRRYHEDGYIWIKNVLPPSDVYDFRQTYFTYIEPTGLLKEGTSPRDGIFNPALDPSKHQGIGATPEQSAEGVLNAIHSDDKYHAFLKHLDLRAMVRELTGWEKEVILNRALIRHNVPGSKCPSGIHYDQLFLRAGDPAFVTAWVPIGDCAADGGGLMCLENSCQLGKELENNYLSRQEREDMPKEDRVSAYNRYMSEDGHLSHNVEQWAKEEGLGLQWLVADYEAGDVVFHSPWMIHCSSRNEDTQGRIRLATDLRFYEKGVRVDERWSRSFFCRDGL